MCDDWKLPIFKKKLTKAGFVFKIGKDKSIPEGVTVILINTDEVDRLKLVVAACQMACKASQN